MAISNRDHNAAADIDLDHTLSRPTAAAVAIEEKDMSLIFDEGPAYVAYPIDEIDSLQRRHDRIPLTGAVMERPPIACGIIRRIQLIGIFPTTRWLSDPTMHPDVKEQFGGTPFFALGDYRVAHVDLLDGSGTTHGLTVVLNKGVEGLMTGYWGAIFERNYPHACCARLDVAGENQTSIKADALFAPRFHEFGCIDFCEEYFEGGAVSWICMTQLERILGLAAEFLLGLRWSDRLPNELIEATDSSCRLERKRRARLARRRELMRNAPDENSAPDQRGVTNHEKSVEPKLMLISRANEPLKDCLQKVVV
jgi:hypothetical protein